MGVLLSLDLGTEGARVGAFSSTDGMALGSVHRPYRTTFPRAGWAEQDVREWWPTVVDASRALLATPACRAAGPVVSLACATTASTVAVVDAAGVPLRPAILWMDSRAAAQAARTAKLAAEHPVLAWSGGSDAAEWLLPKAAWLAEREPETYARAARIVEAVDYLTFRLTGRWVGSQLNAVCKYNYDALAGRFPTELYAALGVEDLVAKLPDEIAPVGAVAGPLTASAAAELGIHAGAPVCVGGIDAHVSLLACGATAGAVSLVSGTSSAMVAELDEPVATHEVWGPYPHALRTSKWLVEGGQVTSGSVLTWAAEGIMGVARPDLTALVAGATAVDPGAHGLRALDTFMGNRTPYRDARLRGAVVGLTLGTTREELYRATVEAVACGTRGVIDSFERAGVACTRLVLSGGIEKNALWQQVTVDVLGREAEIVSGGDNLTLRACAVIGAVGCGLVRDLDEGAAAYAPTTRTLTPDPRAHAVYRQTYDDYVGLLAALAPVMHESVDRLAQR